MLIICHSIARARSSTAKGLHLDRSPLADRVGKTTALLESLTDAIGRHVLSAEAILADDTTVRMLAPGTGKTLLARTTLTAMRSILLGGFRCKTGA
ncbi:IS66 family transposase [Paracoccus sp. (in: a-proteobacteria)]|uniref:IS66 family transposase n=1 Tax=Paracoccus sp. TaxID=267 RepID=UPI0039E59824